MKVKFIFQFSASFRNYNEKKHSMVVFTFPTLQLVTSLPLVIQVTLERKIFHMHSTEFIYILLFSYFGCIVVRSMRASYNSSSLSILIPLQLQICYFWQRWTPSFHVPSQLVHPPNSRPFNRNASILFNRSNHLHVSLTAFPSNDCQNMMQNSV